MSTAKLFQQDVNLRKCNAIITDIREDSNHLFIVLNHTIFFPEGGGQSSDIGSIGDFHVDYVFEKDNTVFHRLQNSDRNIVPKIGDEVLCSIDWNHRFSNMQRHCGEHILSGVFFREYGGINKGFHMGEDYMTIDISLENSPEFDNITQEMADRVEALANGIVWENAPITVSHFSNKSAAEHMPLRKKLSVENNITVVTIGSKDSPYDCVACCGTHPVSTAQVGIIKIFKVENYKGMYRIYCEAGNKAMSYFSQYHKVISALNRKYSSVTFDLLDKIKAQDDKNKAINNELFKIKNSLIAQYAEELLPQLSAEDSFVTAEFPLLQSDDIFKIGRFLEKQMSGILAVSCPAENLVLLFSNGTVPCGDLVKNNAHIYQGKGGGSKTNARAIFPKKEYLPLFIELLEKHLR